jgi:predicted aminopeptidase
MAGRRRQQDFLDLVMRTRDLLAAAYEEEIPDEEKRSRKVDAYTQLREEYVKLKDQWGGFAGYDRWFGESLNNAKLGSVAAYNQLVPAFQELLAEHGGDLTPFYQAVAKLAKLTPDERSAQLPINAAVRSNGKLITATRSSMN